MQGKQLLALRDSAEGYEVEVREREREKESGEWARERGGETVSLGEWHRQRTSLREDG